MPEQGDKNEHISDSDKKLDALADMIRDACAKMDEGHKRLDARMDAFEEKAREDAARRDAASKDADEEEKREDADEGAGEEEKPKEPVADKRKDSAPERQSEGYVEDRKDADEDEAEKRDDADKEDDEAMADHAPISRAEAAALRAEIARLNARAPSIIADADRERFAAIQEQADPAFQAFGDRAPAPLQGETPTQYKRRLGSKLQANSPKWKDARLSGVADEQLLDTILEDVYADSIAAARRGAAVPQGQLREVVHQRGGHTIIEFEGFADSWMNQFAGNSQRATGNWMRPN